MATKWEYFCEQRLAKGYDTELTDHMNSRAAEGWELVAPQYVTGAHPRVWLFWRRQLAES
jgi:hypothetical protein